MQIDFYENIKKYKQQGYDTLYIPVSGIGDGIIFTSVAKAIYHKNGKKVLVSHKHNELYENNPYIQTIDDIFDTKLNKEIESKINDIGINIIYPTYWNFAEDRGKYVLSYPKKHIIAETAAKTGYIGDIDLKPEIFLTEKEKSFGRFSEDRKQIVIMSSSVDIHKQWNKWQDLVDKIKDKHFIIQLGAHTDTVLNGAVDGRGRYSLRECASILYNSDLFVGSIGGLMHLARAVDCPSVIAYSSAEPYYLVNYICNENVKAANPCDKCAKDNTSPYSEICCNNYNCIRSISIEDMLNAIDYKIGRGKQNLAYEKASIIDSCNIGTDNYYKRYSKNLLFAHMKITDRIRLKIGKIYAAVSKNIR